MQTTSNGANVKPLPSSQHAIVIGGSMAGLWAARVLSDHFERVTVIERDHYPDEPTPRKGVPQARHVHILLGRGQQIMEQLFPGMTDELVALGAPRLEIAHDTQLQIGIGKWAQTYHSGRYLLTSSRDLLEFVVRRRVRAIPRIAFLEGMSVADLVTDADKRVVTGVRVQAIGAGHDAADVQTLDADLVVDASGRNSHTPEWLQTLGYAAPESTVVNAFLGYATRWYKRSADSGPDWKWLTIQANAKRVPRGGVIIAVEDDRWVVTVMGVARDYPPTDEEGFNAFARSLQSTDIYDVIQDAEPISPVYGYQRTENVWRHYERLMRWPEHFVVMGDAACAFNPAYGQGMTVSAMSALELDKQLRDAERSGSLVGMGQRFQKGMAKLLQLPWTMATNEDFRYAATEGKRPPKVTRVVQWYLDRVIAMAPDIRALGDLFDGVAQLYLPPTVLFKPWIIWKVLTYRPEKDAQTSSSAAQKHPQPVQG